MADTKPNAVPKTIRHHDGTYWHRTTPANRPAAKTAKCCVCNEPFPMDPGGWKKTVLMVREEQTSIFRGDDIVYFAHPGCVEQVTNA